MIHVSAGILLDQDNVFLAQRPEGKHLAGYWEFPGGKIEPSETPEIALVREFTEEFGVQIRVLSLFHQTVHHYSKGTVKLYAFLATHESGAFVLHEHVAFSWVPINELLGYQLSPADIPIAEKLVKAHKQ